MTAERPAGPRPEEGGREGGKSYTLHIAYCTLHIAHCKSYTLGGRRRGTVKAAKKNVKDVKDAKDAKDAKDVNFTSLKDV